MHPLNAEELLGIWERGRHAPPWQQALFLLAAACPEHAVEALARVSIGRRDSLLLELRELTFGNRLACIVDCPACVERLEFSINTGDIRAGSNEARETFDFHAKEYRATFRLPNTADLAALSGIRDLVTARNTLLATCLLDVSPDPGGDSGGPELPGTARDLPPDVQEAIIQQMREADHQADIQIALTCPACDHRLITPFDVVSFFWQEIDDWAWRTLREIHILARAYGWNEGEILNTSAWRRRVYLEMVQA